jgi:hypothetical protein
MRTGRPPTHGDTRSPEHIAWCNIKARCYKPSHNSYPNYGAKGITVCERWLNSFENFLADMGRRPSLSHSIERKDNSLGYSKENCIWADKKAQARNRTNNRRVTIGGTTLLLCEWADKTGIRWDTLKYRLDAGWPESKLLKPSNHYVRKQPIDDPDWMTEAAA